MAAESTTTQAVLLTHEGRSFSMLSRNQIRQASHHTRCLQVCCMINPQAAACSEDPAGDHIKMATCGHPAGDSCALTQLFLAIQYSPVLSNPTNTTACSSSSTPTPAAGTHGPQVKQTAGTHQHGTSLTCSRTRRYALQPASHVHLWLAAARKTGLSQLVPQARQEQLPHSRCCRDDPAQPTI
jgi:hypothetical protein